MNNTEQIFLPDWVVLGDNSRAIFVSWILTGKKPDFGGSDMIWLRGSDRLTIDLRNGQWYIETPIVLPRMTICVSLAARGFSDIEASVDTKYAVLEQFPFRKESSINELKRLKNNDKNVLIVLMNMPRRQGSTDMIAPGKDLEQAVAAYQDEGFDVLTISGPDDVWKLLHWHRTLYDDWLDKVRLYLKEMSVTVSEYYIEDEYFDITESWEKEDGGPLRIQEQNIWFSYRSASREKGATLWDRFAAVAKRAVFPSSGYGPLTPVMELYRRCLDNPLTFWSVDEDIESLMHELRTSFDRTIDHLETNNNYRDRTELPARMSEELYYQIIAKSGDSGTALNAVFSRMIGEFLRSTVKQSIRNRLELRYRQLEDIIP